MKKRTKITCFFILLPKLGEIKGVCAASGQAEVLYRKLTIYVIFYTLRFLYDFESL
jgi:hypothetical protein